MVVLLATLVEYSRYNVITAKGTTLIHVQLLAPANSGHLKRA